MQSGSESSGSSSSSSSSSDRRLDALGLLEAQWETELKEAIPRFFTTPSRSDSQSHSVSAINWAFAVKIIEKYKKQFGLEFANELCKRLAERVWSVELRKELLDELFGDTTSDYYFTNPAEKNSKTQFRFLKLFLKLDQVSSEVIEQKIKEQLRQARSTDIIIDLSHDCYCWFNFSFVFLFQLQDKKIANQVKQVKFDGSNLSGTNLHNSPSSPEIDYTNSNLDNADLMGVVLKKTQVRGTVLEGLPELYLTRGLQQCVYRLNIADTCSYTFFAANDDDDPRRSDFRLNELLNKIYLLTQKFDFKAVHCFSDIWPIIHKAISQYIADKRQMPSSDEEATKDYAKVIEALAVILKCHGDAQAQTQTQTHYWPITWEEAVQQVTCKMHLIVGQVRAAQQKKFEWQSFLKSQSLIVWQRLLRSRGDLNFLAIVKLLSDESIHLSQQIQSQLSIQLPADEVKEKLSEHVAECIWGSELVNALFNTLVVLFPKQKKSFYSLFENGESITSEYLQDLICRNVKKSGQPIQFGGRNFCLFNFRNMIFGTKIIFEQCDFWAADFRRMDLTQVDFSGSHLRGANLKGATLLENGVKGTFLESCDSGYLKNCMYSGNARSDFDLFLENYSQLSLLHLGRHHQAVIRTIRSQIKLEWNLRQCIAYILGKIIEQYLNKNRTIQLNLQDENATTQLITQIINLDGTLMKGFIFLIQCYKKCSGDQYAMRPEEAQREILTLAKHGLETIVNQKSSEKPYEYDPNRDPLFSKPPMSAMASVSVGASSAASITIASSYLSTSAAASASLSYSSGRPAASAADSAFRSVDNQMRMVSSSSSNCSIAALSAVNAKGDRDYQDDHVVGVKPSSISNLVSDSSFFSSDKKGGASACNTIITVKPLIKTAVNANIVSGANEGVSEATIDSNPTIKRMIMQ